MTIRMELLTGGKLVKALPALANLRITVFRDWPYLYDGTLEYEQNYLEKFGKADDAVIVAALDVDTIVGVATASPMIGRANTFAEPFRKHGMDVDPIFYFGESVLLKPYRGRGIGNAFFDQREAYVRQRGGFTHTTFCGVVRPDDHPRRPKAYVPLDAFWAKRGYRRIEGLIVTFSWTDIGETEQTAKPMQFWIRPL